MKAEFDKLPRDLEELSALLHEQQALAHLSAGQNGEIVKEYENRENEIKARKNELHKQMAKLDQLRASIAALEKEWRPEITKLVAKVSESFGKFMGGEPPHLPLLISRTRILFFSFLLFLFFFSFLELQCMGECKISEDEDFAKWGIQILVKFRDTEMLQVLTRQRQSGGVSDFFSSSSI